MDGKVTGRDQEVQVLLGPSARWLERLGMLHLPGGPPVGLKVLRGVGLVVVDLLLCTPAGLLLLVDPPADAEIYREVTYCFFAIFTWMLRTVFFLLERSRLEKLVTILLDLRKQFPDDGSGIRKKHQKRAAMISFAWQFAPVLALPTWFVQPLLERHYVTHGNVTELQMRTPMLMLLPFDDQKSPNYEIVYALQFIVIFFVVETTVLMDIFFVNMMIFLTAELDVLNANISRMHLHVAAQSQTLSLEKSGVPEYSDAERGLFKAKYFYKKSKTKAEDGPLDSEPAYTNGASGEYKRLVKNIRHHQRIMICIDELEAAMNKSFTIVLVLSSVIICLHAFAFVEILDGVASRASAIKRTQAFIAYLIHNGFFCFIGQSITNQSERLAHSAFSCGWADADPKFKRALAIVMRQASRPLVINVGKFFPLSRNTYMQIINTSYTIFNMMLSLHYKDT